MIKLIFVRHGESEKNTLDVKSCSLDKFPLTEKGRREVNELTKKIKDRIDLIITSPVLRARETADILNKKFNVKIVIDPLVSEYDYGEWNDRTKKELLENDEDYRRYRRMQPGEERYNFKLGRTGESRKEIVERVRKFVEKIKNEYSDKNILIVSHGGINAAIYKVLNDCSIEEYFRQEDIDYNDVQTFIIK
ncbi:MAG: histidine phosphatase family protein [Patescibacteria group bacterium]|nr:histidine phosphatase family protein [Patescibacteria group bacterium]